MPNFQSRLREAQTKGDMSLADMARWFDVPFQTVRYWTIVAGSDMAPRGPRGRTILKRLKQLEWAITHSIGFPVPEMLRARDRPLHIERTRDAVNAALSASDTSL